MNVGKVKLVLIQEQCTKALSWWSKLLWQHKLIFIGIRGKVKTETRGQKVARDKVKREKTAILLLSQERAW